MAHKKKERKFWTEEFKFEHFGNQRREYVRRKAREILNDESVVLPVKHVVGFVIVWKCFRGFFRSEKAGVLIRVKGIRRN